MRKCKDWLELG